MEIGLYETLLTRGLSDALDGLAGYATPTRDVDNADAPHVLARHVTDALERYLSTVRNPDDRLRIVNDLINRFAETSLDVLTPPRQLMSISEPAGPGTRPFTTRPATPLSDAALLTNASGEPSLGAELRAEFESADEVDLLCAFVKWHGLRLLEPELAAARARDVPLRVITTTYMGATERAAIVRTVAPVESVTPYEGFQLPADRGAPLSTPSGESVRPGGRPVAPQR